jgi:hypothetical protein
MPDVFWAAFAGAAAAGLITLVAVLIAEWFRWFLDRPLVLVKVVWVYPLDTLSGDIEEEIGVEAINPHSKPVTLSSYGFAIKGGETSKVVVTEPSPYRLPYELGGGKSLTERIAVEDMVDALKRSGRNPADLECAWFRASSGKVFSSSKLSKAFIQALEKKFQRMNESSTPSPPST